ncbi:MAG TPA: succinylglutamate desuccinylase/aspartoacylase family protein [Thiolinea sp.]|nr:succinylglutamate desuccinylase/aspartoacylase family protein [Thiolinea sp.]
MKQSPISVGGMAVAAGERRYIELPLPDLYNHSRITMPVYVIHGRQPGPRLFVSAALHGDEINGVEIIRRLVRLKALDSLRGSLLAVPVVNVFGFLSKSRYLPDRRDLNRSFPGHESGSLAARIAHLFMEEIVSRTTHGIDLHTAAIGRDNLPQIRVDLNSKPELTALACAFQTPVVLNAGIREGTLRQSASSCNVDTILYEAGEALRFDEIPIRVGVRGIVAVMRHLKMLPPGRRKLPSFEPLMSNGSKWVRTPQSGIMRVTKAMGSVVNEGDILGHVADPFGTTEVTVRATCSGIIIGRSTLPLIHEGEAIFHIAQINKGHDVASAMQYLHHEMDPDTGTL